MTPRQQNRDDRRKMHERALQRRESDARVKAALAMRERWSRDQREQEQERLETEIKALIEAGKVTICPSGTRDAR